MKRSLLLIAFILAMVAMPVFASTLTDAIYLSDVSVVNVGAATTNVAVPFSLSTSSLIANNFINATCTDTAMQINGADVAFMPAPGDTSNWIVYVPTIGTSTLTAQLYLGGSTDMDSKLAYFPLPAGYTALDSPTLELGNNFKIEIKGYFDLSTYTAPNTEFVIYKNGAFTVYYNSATAIKVVLLGTGFSVTANGLTSGDHTLIIEADATDLNVYYDGVIKGTGALGAASVSDNASNWQFLYHTGNTLFVVPYMEYEKIWIPHDAVATDQYITWNYDTSAPYIFTDLSGGGHDATATLRTTSSDGDVSASITGMAPIDESKATNFSVTGGTTLISSLPGAIPNMYDEGETGGLVIDDLINEAATTADIPNEFIWYPIAFAIAIGLGFAAFGWTKSLIVQSIVSGVVMAFFCGGGILGDGLIPYWTVIVFAIEAVFMIIIQERQQV